MFKNSIALHLEEFNYGELYVFSDKLYRNLLVSTVFTSPKPSLADQLIANDALKNRLINWGSQGNRGSHLDLALLQSADALVRDNTRTLARHCMSERPNDPAAWETVGFVLRKPHARVGKVESVQDFHQVISRLTSLDEITLAWKRPLATHKWTRITYKVLRSPDGNIQNAVQVGLLMNKCKFVDNVKGLAPVQYYWIVPVNTYGNGMVSELCIGVALRV